MALKNDAKFEEKLSCGLKNDMRNFGKIENWNFDRILLSKVEKV